MAATFHKQFFAKINLVGPRLDTRRLWPALFLVVAGILFCRNADNILHPNLYAEDGMIFFSQQYESGFVASLQMPYAGYRHVAPRIVAAVCALAPLEYLPLAYAAAALLVAAGVLTFFFAAAFRAVIDDDSLRAGIVLLFTVLPNAEGLMKVAFLNWYMLLFIALVTLFALPTGTIARCLFFVPVAVTACSSPVTVVCLPLFFTRAWTGKDRGERLWWLSLVFVVIAVVVLGQPKVSLFLDIPDDMMWLWPMAHAIGYRIFCFFFFGSSFCHFISNDAGGIIGASLVLAGAMVYLADKASRKISEPIMARRTPVMLFYLILALPVMLELRPEWFFAFRIWGEGTWRGNDRYFFSSTVLLCILCGVIYERLFCEWAAKGRRRHSWCAVVLFGWLGLQAFGFKIDDFARTSLDWQESARRIRAAENKVLRDGGREKIIVPNCVKGFDYILLVTPAAAKRDQG